MKRKIQRDIIRTYLKRRFQDSGVADLHMERIEPVLSKIDSGKYELAPEGEQDAAGIAEVLDRVLGDQVTKVVFVPLKTPYDRPDWMDGQAQRRTFPDVLQGSVQTRMSEHLWNSMSSGLYYRLGGSIADAEWSDAGEELWSCLLSSIGGSMFESMDAAGLAVLGPDPETVVWLSLFSYLGAAVTHDEAEVQRLLPILELLPSTVPIGRRVGAYGYYLALVE